MPDKGPGASLRIIFCCAASTGSSVLQRRTECHILAHNALDGAAPGVSDAEWCELLAQASGWQPARGRLTVIAPQPGAEILGAGGLIHAWAKRDLPITIVSVTDGDASPSTGSASPHEAARRALQSLSASTASTHRLGLPAGAVSEQEGVLYRDLLHYAPAGTTLVAPFDYDGHPDHDAVGRVCLDVAAARDVVIARYPVWLWHQVAPTAAAGLRWASFTLSPQARAAKARALQGFEAPPWRTLHALGYFSRSFEAFVLR